MAMRLWQNHPLFLFGVEDIIDITYRVLSFIIVIERLTYGIMWCCFLSSLILDFPLGLNLLYIALSWIWFSWIRIWFESFMPMFDPTNCSFSLDLFMPYRSNTHHNFHAVFRWFRLAWNIMFVCYCGISHEKKITV